MKPYRVMRAADQRYVYMGTDLVKACAAMRQCSEGAFVFQGQGLPPADEPIVVAWGTETPPNLIATLHGVDLETFTNLSKG